MLDTVTASPGSPALTCGASGSAPLFTERYYFPNFVVAVAELLAGFGSNVAALTVAVMFHEQADVSPPLAHRWAQEKVCVPFFHPLSESHSAPSILPPSSAVAEGRRQKTWIPALRFCSGHAFAGRDCVAIPFMVREPHHERYCLIANSGTYPFALSLSKGSEWIATQSRKTEGAVDFQSTLLEPLGFEPRVVQLMAK